jgi:hypothetical protein
MMGFLDDIVSLPGRIINAGVALTSEAIAQTLCLPIKVVDTAIEAGCKTVKEIEAFARKHGLD